MALSEEALKQTGFVLRDAAAIPFPASLLGRNPGQALSHPSSDQQLWAVLLSWWVHPWETSTISISLRHGIGAPVFISNAIAWKEDYLHYCSVWEILPWIKWVWGVSPVLWKKAWLNCVIWGHKIFRRTIARHLSKTLKQFNLSIFFILLEWKCSLNIRGISLGEISHLKKKKSY